MTDSSSQEPTQSPDGSAAPAAEQPVEEPQTPSASEGPGGESQGAEDEGEVSAKEGSPNARASADRGEASPKDGAEDEPSATEAVESASDTPADNEAALGEDSHFGVFWRLVEENWDEDAPHHALMEYAAGHDLLGLAAERYRGLLEDETRGEAAKKRLQGVAIVAMSTLQAQKTEPSKGFPPWVSGVVIFLFIGLALYVAYRALEIL